MSDTTPPNGNRMPSPPPAVERSVTDTANPAPEPPPILSDGSETRYEPSHREIMSGIALLTIWILIFALGVIFPSDPFRDALVGANSKILLRESPLYILMFLLTYTVSNVAILCCVSAWLGELGRRTRIDGAAQNGPFLRGDYIAAVMRGFLVYLAILTGYVVVGTGVNVFVVTSPESYVRLAAVVSLAGFMLGFNPSILKGFENRLTGTITTERDKDGKEKTTVTGIKTVDSTEKANNPTGADGTTTEHTVVKFDGA